MEVKKKAKVWLAAAVAFGLSCSFTSWVYSGASIYSVPVIANIAGAFYDEASTGSSAGSDWPTIVIDAGHGGIDGGASTRGGVMERDLALSIARSLEDVVSEYPVRVVMTRTDDAALSDDDDRTIRAKKQEDMRRRREIIEKADAEITVSIHMNSFVQDESVYGAQVFYAESDEAQTDPRTVKRTSKDFAQSVQKSLETNIPDGRERAIKSKNDVFLLKNATYEIILVECGFLSNPREADLLQTAEYQHLLAKSIWQGINEILCLEKRQKLQIISSANKSA